MDLSTPTWHGDVHPAYDNPRPEVTPHVPASARRVLDVGCSTGAMGAFLRERGHHVTGVEFAPELAVAARQRLDAVVEGDIETMARDDTGPEGPFDCIVFADVLEHLRDPWAVVQWGGRRLAPGGTVVVSVPNIRHLETLWALVVRKRWPYKDVGIFDRTHLRFFARRNLPELFRGTGLRVTGVHRSYVLSLSRSPRFNRIARYLGDFGTLQFIVTARAA